ncbi:hypothetical protein Z946_3799 [Sulfitobacter noctilucicola]|uniref:Uncharacterized protein n=1 Tax=Sulfitobacter noctilucicola TaxID=1342301 RepID=A0A7W6M7P6_9RHOB|nr:hypothetical protein [Sulfitobacter noctilucicola]KIN64905.1 hypothetical protein Z946_3799 [Sulfitobacter noctilucicola]MBB4173954.1 hypothetical protein [Sulfitobacter noctilucicola]
MTFSASTDGSTATITVTVLNSTANLKVEDASGLGDQLEALVNDQTAHPIDNSPAYMTYPTDTGVRIANRLGQIDIPWRWIMPVANQLRQ